MHQSRIGRNPKTFSVGKARLIASGMGQRLALEQPGQNPIRFVLRLDPGKPKERILRVETKLSRNRTRLPSKAEVELFKKFLAAVEKHFGFKVKVFGTRD